MREFDYQYANLPHRLKPWEQMRKEEKTYVVYNAYLQNYLRSSDVQTLVRLHQGKVALQFASAPLLYLLFARAVPRFAHRFRVFNRGVARAAAVTLAVPSWFLLRRWGPLQLAYNAEREKILEYLDDNMSYGMVALNKMLPRHWSENWVGGHLRRLHARRNSLFTGLLYPYEEHAPDVVVDREYDPENVVL